MTIEELLQLMRTCNMKQVREALEQVVEEDKWAFDVIVDFYKTAASIEP